MNRTFLIFSLLLVTLCTAPVWAAPARVGVITVENGRVSLNGQPISTPQLVEQGGKLVLQKGARARLQLLGDNREVSLVGPRTITVNKAALQKIARVVPRGNMAAVPDIGTTTRSAAKTVRTESEQKHVRGFRLVTPPTAKGDAWVFPVETTEAFFDEKEPRRASWSVSRLEIAGETVLKNGRAMPTYSYFPIAGGDSSGREKTIAVPKSLIVPGQRYVLEVAVDAGTFELGRYQQPFRVLSAEEKAVLADWEADAQQRARFEGSVTPLLELASLYLDWDQIADVRRVLGQARNSAGWAKLEPGALQRAEKLQQTLDTIWDNP